MQKHRVADVDPWCVLPSEDLVVDGIKVHVRGLSYQELTDASRGCKSDAETARALVCASVTRSDGKEITSELIATSRPDVFKALADAVARVNGFNEGNLNATGADGSSTA
jgi:hypothetical protein